MGGRYTGHSYQSNSSLWLAWRRGYDAEIGRWLSEDPIGVQDGPNRYAYVRGNPVKLIDPDGRAAVLPLAGGLGAAAWIKSCQSKAISEAERHFGPWDKKKHCYTSCYFNRCILMSPVITLLGGLVHELVDWKEDAVDDLKANWYGVKVSYKFWVSCEMSCESCPVK
jgi:RHS repeat-associated protein